ncbi:MAG: hypothetical protein HY799_12085 [Nitrosomonadales bacterium]|nr:hypothetical protein [Nitrosomonadales bacterium]
MVIRTLAVSALACSLMLGGSVALAADKVQAQDRTQDQTRLQDQEQIYGSQLMTEQERLEHRNMMRTLKTQEEREAYRLEHHKKMQVRAKEKGVTLPEEPLPRGRMMRGPGTGGGMGSGGGMGPGGRN